MFIANLNVDQQEILLFLAERIMNANGSVSTEERRMLEFLKSQCDGVGPAVNVSYEILPSIFNTMRSKSSLLLELISMAYADETYHEEESHIIETIAKSLSLSKELVEDMEFWVKRQFILLKESEAFMEY